jgi:hypothetical protein
MARSKTVRPDKTQAHIESLMAQGATGTSIADASGVTETVVRAIRRGARNSILRETQDKILAIKQPPLGPARPAIGAMRKLRALAIQGYSLYTISQAIPKSTPFYFSNVRSGHKVYILKARDEEIDRYYKFHKNTQGPDRQAAKRAAKLGWYGPEAWEGVDIDNPKSEPKVLTS